MVWMNIDKPTKECVIHMDSNCRYLKEMEETQYKGVRELKRDGGWLYFSNIRDAEEYVLSHYDNYSLLEHCVSNKTNGYHLSNENIKDNNDFTSDPTPFNSVTDHYTKIMGFPSKRVNTNILPNWLKIFYYAFISFLSIGFIFILYIIIFKR